MLRTVLAGQQIPSGALQVRDDQLRTWHLGGDGLWRDAVGHRVTGAELVAGTDLVVQQGEVTELGRGR